MAGSDSDTTRVYKASTAGKASVEIGEASVAVAGDSRHFIVVDDRGTSIKGPISIISDAMGTRRGGLFVGINDFLHMIPSTLVSPIPNQIPVPPIQGMTAITKDVAFFLAMLV
jgi:hypothetical protein